MTEPGPIQSPPVLVTSFGDFQRRFGGLLPFVSASAGGEHGHLLLGVKHFFDNGGTRAFIARAFQLRDAADIRADLRTVQLATGVVARLRSNASVESTANPPPAQMISVSTLRGFGYNGVAAELRRETGVAATSAINAAFPAFTQVRIDPGIAPADGVHRSDTAFVLLQPTAANANVRITAREPGVWAEKLRVAVRPIQLPPVRLVAFPAATTLQVSSASSFYLGCAIELRRTAQPAGTLTDVFYATVTAIVGNTLTIAAPAVALPAYNPPVDEVEVSVCELEVLLEWATTVETHRGAWRWMTAANSVGYTPEQRSDFNQRRSLWGALVRNESQLAVVAAADVLDYDETDPLGTHPTTENAQPVYMQPWTGLANAPPAGQPDLPPRVPDYLGNSGAGPGQRSAIASLADEETISLVAVPASPTKSYRAG